MNKIKLATVFSGIGSIEFSLKRLGLEHEIVFACDNGEREIDYDADLELSLIRGLKNIDDKQKYVEELYKSKTSKKNYVQMSYLHNYPHCPKNRYFQDIRLLDGNDFHGEVDLFVGGSPCQSFSTVGFQQGLEDARGTLFYDYARLVKEIQPKVFIFENVRGLLTHDKGNTWTVIKGIFDSLGYHIEYDILNSMDFGIPQNRRRLFVVGFREHLNYVIPKKANIELKYTMHDFLIYNCKEGCFQYNNNGDLVVQNTPGIIDERYILSQLIYNYVMKGGTKTFYQKPEINKEIARTLLKTMGNRHRAGIDNYVSSDFSNDFGKVRMLSEREAHRLMGFTDDYEIVVSRSQAYKQAGNSIVVDVLMHLVKSIIDTNVFH